MKKKFISLLLTFCMLLFLIPGSVQAEETGTTDDTVILYTNDIHTYIDGAITYSKVAALKQSFDEALLLDAGDHIQGTAYGSMDKGENMIRLMNAAGYDAATLGNHEFDYGMTGCMQAIDWADYPYLSCNFFHEKNGVQEDSVLDAYQVFEVNGRRVAVIGITTPESIYSSTPSYFQDENGSYIYGIAGGSDGQALYTAVQTAIDAAAREADVIIALGHLGDDATSAPWRSEDVIANTTGLDAFIDGHSHSTVPMKRVTDKGGDTVILTQTGEYLNAVGKMTISEEGITTELLTAEDLQTITPDPQTKQLEDNWISELDAQLGTVIGTAEVTFDNYRDGKRLVRVQETNSGDFATDALYYLFDHMDMDVDVAFMNGGGIRNEAITGAISYQTCKQIHTFGSVACLQTVTGQQILDALEWGSRSVGESEEGSFLHVSGLTYKIDTSIPNTIQADDKGVWTGGPTGAYRVHDVKVYDKESKTWKDLDLSAHYNLAGYNYVLRDLGDGFAMFDGAVNVLDYVMEDYMVLANYVTAFENGAIQATNSPLAEKYPGFLVDYSTVNGSGRIAVEQKYPVWIGGRQITSTDTAGDGWSYDADTATLTLTDYTYSGPGYKHAAIYAEAPLHIVLKGDNQITCSDYYGILVKQSTLDISGVGSLQVAGSDYGIYTTQWNVGALTIREQAKIQAKSGDVTSGNSYGIRADGALTIKDSAIVSATAGYAPGRSCGIYAYTTLDISGSAAVTAQGGSLTAKDGKEVDSYGIRTTDMTMDGGTLVTTGGMAKYASCGIYTQTLEVHDGRITALGGTVLRGPSVGVQGIKSVTVHGGWLEAAGSNSATSADLSCGIQSSGPVTVDGGEVLARTGMGGYTRGIQAAALTVKDSTVTAKATNAIRLPEGDGGYSSGIQLEQDLIVEDGTVQAIGADAADFSFGIQTTGSISCVDGKIAASCGTAATAYGIYVLDGTENGGYLTIDCEEIQCKTQEDPCLIGTTIQVDGAVFVENGITIDEKLKIYTPVNGQIAKQEGGIRTYYTIVETDGTAAEKTLIEPELYQVQIMMPSGAQIIPVPAGASINDTYCEALGISDYSQYLRTDREGYTFGGWYAEETCQIPYDFDAAVTADTIVYGKWILVSDGDNAGVDSGDGSANGGNSDNTDGTSPSDKQESPLTGDANAVWWIVAAAAICMAAVGTKKRHSCKR